MDLNVQDWKEFRVGRMFRLEPVKGKTTDDLIAGSDIPYIAAKHDDNGLDMMCQKSGFEDWVSEGNCIVFVQLGEGSSGYVNYIPDDFIGMNGKVSCGYLDGVMNPYVGLFLEVILCQERPKHSFGRSWTGTRLTETVIKLPIQHNPDGTPVIDADKTYSDEGYIPDWQFMEDYIKSLHSEPITTTRGAAESLSLGVDKWEDFKLSSIMDITNGKGITDNEIAENTGTLPAIQGGESDNGILGYIDELYCKENKYPIINENCLTVARVGTAGFVSFHDKCVIGDKAKALTFTDKSIASIAKYLFMCSVLNQNRYKYSYGRGLVTDVYMAEIIKLPIQHDASGNPVIDPDKKYSDKGYIPDWDFMERYIDSLPYSDKIA